MRCRTCGNESYEHRICPSCLNKWTEAKKAIWDYHEEKYGKLTQENLPIRQKETKKFMKIWKNNKQKFKELLGA